MLPGLPLGRQANKCGFHHKQERAAECNRSAHCTIRGGDSWAYRASGPTNPSPLERKRQLQARSLFCQRQTRHFDIRGDMRGQSKRTWNTQEERAHKNTNNSCQKHSKGCFVDCLAMERKTGGLLQTGGQSPGTGFVYTMLTPTKPLGLRSWLVQCPPLCHKWRLR